jgi:methanogenic corrinoid protein MtbC1
MGPVAGKILPWIFGPATAAARRDRAQRAGSAARGYPRSEHLDDPTGNAVALAATRALLTVQTRAEAAQVLHTAVHDLGGAIVPARLAGDDAIPVDVSLGAGEPRVVVADALDMAGMRLAQHLPLLVEDAQRAAARYEPSMSPAGDAQVGGMQAADGPGQEEQPATTTSAGYFDALSNSDIVAATAVLTVAVEQGETPHQLIRDVVVPAQRRVGEMWFSGAWNVADEHAATAVAEQTLTLIAAPRTSRASRSASTSSASSRSATDTVLIACAEGEWHTLPARLAAELARTDDLDLVLLGGSIPADHLRQRLRADQPAALALSCTMATNLIGATRSIEAAHAEGIPVIAGGAAWGPGSHRATRLGADLRLDDPAELADGLQTVWGTSLAEPLPPVAVEALLLDAAPPELLVIALERQCAANPWMRGMRPYQRERSLEDLGWLARHAAAGVACDDPTIVRQLLDWLVGLLTPRGVPVDAVLESSFYLADSIEADAPTAAEMLRGEAASALDQQGRDRRP